MKAGKWLDEEVGVTGKNSCTTKKFLILQLRQNKENYLKEWEAKELSIKDVSMKIFLLYPSFWH